MSTGVVAGVAGIVLCGGTSTRMGASKALLPFGAEMMVQRVTRILGTVTAPVIVVGAPQQSLPELSEDVIIARDRKERRGPLEGLCAGLQSLPPTCDRAYVSSCDAPLMTPAFVQRLVELQGDADVAVVEIDGMLHPLSALYHRRVLYDVERLLRDNCLRMTMLLDAVRTRVVRPHEVADADPGLQTLRNINTRQDYLDALAVGGFR